jgi:hypothetical protein
MWDGRLSEAHDANERSNIFIALSNRPAKVRLEMGSVEGFLSLPMIVMKCGFGSLPRFRIAFSQR